MGFLKLKAMRENRERRRPVKEEYGLIFEGSPIASPIKSKRLRIQKFAFIAKPMSQNRVRPMVPIEEEIT